MGRNRHELTGAEEQHLLACIARGDTVARAHESMKAMGCRLSVASITRRMRELAGQAAIARQATPPLRPVVAVDGELPETPDEIPDGTGLETFDRWIEMAERMATRAELDKNLVELGKAGRLVVMFLEAKRKATPIAPPDPNDSPDMIAAAARAREALHKLVDTAVGK